MLTWPCSAPLPWAPGPGSALRWSLEKGSPYSGMLPAHVAGDLSWRPCTSISALWLARGVRLIEAEVVGVDATQRQLRFADRPPLSYDVLSVDCGITPALDEVPGARGKVLPTKPISTFLPRLAAALRPSMTLWRRAARSRGWRWGRWGRAGPGSAGPPGAAITLELFTAGGCILPTLPPRARRKALRALAAAKIAVRFEARVAAVEDGPTLRLATGRPFPPPWSYGRRRPRPRLAGKLGPGP